MNGLWRATPEWQNEVAFVVAGGPSAATQDIGLLRGRKVIVVNCAYVLVPDADYLIFADSRFYHHYQKQITQFKGTVICCSTTVKGVNRMQRKSTPGLSRDPGMVMVKLTTLTAAINLAVLLGSRGIILLGADGQPAPDGRTHHHVDHPWRQLNGCWNKQKGDLKPIAADLAKMNIPCINASPGSAWSDLWPVMSLPEAIAAMEEKCRTSSAETLEVAAINAQLPGKAPIANSLAQ